MAAHLFSNSTVNVELRKDINELLEKMCKLLATAR